MAALLYWLVLGSWFLSMVFLGTRGYSWWPAVWPIAPFLLFLIIALKYFTHPMAAF